MTLRPFLCGFALLASTGCTSVTVNYVEDILVEVPLQDIGPFCDPDEKELLGGKLLLFITPDPQNNICDIRAGAQFKAIDHDDIVDVIGKSASEDAVWSSGGICPRGAVAADDGTAIAQCDYGPWVTAEWRDADTDDDYVEIGADDLVDSMQMTLDIGYPNETTTLEVPEDALIDDATIQWASDGATFPEGSVTLNHDDFFDTFEEVAPDDIYTSAYGTTQIALDELPDFVKKEYVISFGFQLYLEGGVDMDSVSLWQLIFGNNDD